ncbi:MAG: hypothetical protein N3G19_00140 [Candidatus Pacearchaeota archaeon]|nr:hypothetical protein [Candidatus Pacearchaeota archaeon]
MIFHNFRKENRFDKGKEELIKNSFQRMKEDILYLQQELVILKQELAEIKQILQSNTYSTQIQHPTHIPTYKMENYGLKQANFHSSIGNEGVPTDRQQINNKQFNELKRTFNVPIDSSANASIASISSVVNDLKQELKEKFQKLSKQEFVIFSILYTLQEEKGFVTYKDLASRARLAESSVRDYILKLEHKGIPIIKERLNNKIVILKIPKELKDIATLDSLSKLKNLERLFTFSL